MSFFTFSYNENSSGINKNSIVNLSKPGFAYYYVSVLSAAQKCTGQSTVTTQYHMQLPTLIQRSCCAGYILPIPQCSNFGMFTAYIYRSVAVGYSSIARHRAVASANDLQRWSPQIFPICILFNKKDGLITKSIPLQRSAWSQVHCYRRQYIRLSSNCLHDELKKVMKLEECNWVIQNCVKKLAPADNVNRKPLMCFSLKVFSILQ